MKVLHLTGGGDVGGAKTHVISLVKNLSKHIDVTLVSFRSGPFAQEAEDVNIDTKIIQSGSFIADIIKVIRLAKKGQYQIIHPHGSKANMAAVIVKAFTGLPVVTTVHSDYKLDYMHSALRRYTFGLINTVALRFVDYYTCVSKNLKDSLIERNFKPNKLFTIPNGIDFEQEVKPCTRSEFAAKFNLNISESDVLVGILARLTPVKGVKIFIQAAKEVLKNNPHVKFLIAGDGDERKVLENIVESEGLSDSIFFLGFISESYDFLSIIDINVLSSLSEGFPYSILEGALLRKATISSNVGGIPDLIEHGETGYLFNPGDSSKLAELILDLSGNIEKRNSLGDKIYTKAKALFSLDTMCKVQMDIYDTILKTTDRKYKYDIIISGYYGFRNSGDDAILMAIINDLRRFKENVRIVVLSKNPIETVKHYKVDSINRLNLFNAIRVFRKSKLFINGGGNLLQDDTSTRSLMYYLGATWLAKKLGAKVMVYANGIGPINKKINRTLTKKVLNKVDVITLREELSRKELDSLQVKKPVITVTADPALTVKSISESAINNILLSEKITKSGPLIGFSARTCENNLIYDESIISKAADFAVEKFNAVPVFIPMQPVDLTIIESIVSKMKHKGYILHGNYEVNDILGIISKMDMVVGMRLHSLIYAANLGVPVVGLVYDPKIEGFLQYFHQTSAGHIKDMTFEKLTEVMTTVWNNRASIKKELNIITAQLKEKALENAKIAVDLINSQT